MDDRGAGGQAARQPGSQIGFVCLRRGAACERAGNLGSALQTTRAGLASQSIMSTWPRAAPKFNRIRETAPSQPEVARPKGRAAFNLAFVAERAQVEFEWQNPSGTIGARRSKIAL